MKKPVRKQTQVPASVRAIWRAVRSIPRGQFASYGEIARRAGMPRRARLVGHALRRAPPDLDLPWFRVTAKDGRIAFPKGTKSHREQLRRLRQEGVRIQRGRAVPRTDDLDSLLWKPG